MCARTMEFHKPISCRAARGRLCVVLEISVCQRFDEALSGATGTGTGTVAQNEWRTAQQQQAGQGQWDEGGDAHGEERRGVWRDSRSETNASM